MWLVELWSNVWMTGSTTMIVFRSKFPHSIRSPSRGHTNNYRRIDKLNKTIDIVRITTYTRKEDTQLKIFEEDDNARKREINMFYLLTNSSLKSCACFSAVLAWSTIWLRRSWSSNWAMSGLEPFVRNLVETPHGFTHFISSVLFWEFITGALCTDSTSRITNALPNPGNKNNHIRFLNALIIYIVVKLLTVINKLQWNSFLLYMLLKYYFSN